MSTDLKFTDLVSQNTREAILSDLQKAVLSPQAAGMTLGEILADLESHPDKRETMLSLTPVELRTWFTTSDKPARAKAESTDRPVADWNDAARTAHAAKVLAFLTEKGLGEDRGFTPAALRSTLDGSEVQMREVLKALEDGGKVVFTGKTKGKKYVVAGLRAQAESVLQTEQAEAAKAKAEKDARKAEADAKAAKAAKAESKATAKK